MSAANEIGLPADNLFCGPEDVWYLGFWVNYGKGQPDEARFTRLLLGGGPLREYRDVTPLGWGNQYEARIFASRESLRLINKRRCCVQHELEANKCQEETDRGSPRGKLHEGSSSSVGLWLFVETVDVAISGWGQNYCVGPRWIPWIWDDAIHDIASLRLIGKLWRYRLVRDD